MRAKRNMITQALKRWLQKLFAWWPWKSTPATGYSQAVRNSGTTQETVWRTTMEGPLPQAGMMSVAVEQDEAVPEQGWMLASTEDHTERPVQPVSPTAEHSGSPGELSAPSPTFEQQLEFLHYLVKRGLVNEGFTEGQVPKQYRRKFEKER
jgi:hypothetical protein